MLRSNCCRLCIKICNGHQSLYDENGQTNEVYKLMASYFAPALLNMELDKHFRNICMDCWHHLTEFYAFQESVILAQNFKYAIDDSEAVVNSEKSRKSPTDDVNRTTNCIEFPSDHVANKSLESSREMQARTEQQSKITVELNDCESAHSLKVDRFSQLDNQDTQHSSHSLTVEILENEEQEGQKSDTTTYITYEVKSEHPLDLEEDGWMDAIENSDSASHSNDQLSSCTNNPQTIAISEEANQEKYISYEVSSEDSLDLYEVANPDGENASGTLNKRYSSKLPLASGGSVTDLTGHDRADLEIHNNAVEIPSEFTKRQTKLLPDLNESEDLSGYYSSDDEIQLLAMLASTMNTQRMNKRREQQASALGIEAGKEQCKTIPSELPGSGGHCLTTSDCYSQSSAILEESKQETTKTVTTTCICCEVKSKDPLVRCEDGCDAIGHKIDLSTPTSSQTVAKEDGTNPEGQKSGSTACISYQVKSEDLHVGRYDVFGPSTSANSQTVDVFGPSTSANSLTVVQPNQTNQERPKSATTTCISYEVKSEDPLDIYDVIENSDSDSETTIEDRGISLTDATGHGGTDLNIGNPRGKLSELADDDDVCLVAGSSDIETDDLCEDFSSDDQVQKSPSNKKRRKHSASAREGNSSYTGEYKRLKTVNHIDTFIAQWRPNLECVICSETSSSFTLLIEHFKQQHPTERSRIQCCQRDFQYRYEIVQHIYYHRNTSPYNCHECCTSFTTKRSLDDHKLYKHCINFTDKTYKCLQCELKFSRRTELSRHLKYCRAKDDKEKAAAIDLCAQADSTNLIIKPTPRYYRKSRLRKDPSEP